jgi:hypothetical protein
VAAIVTEVEGLKSVGFALKVVLRNDWDFADVILLCVVPDIWKIIEPLSSGSSSPRRGNQEEIILSYDLCAF